MTRDQLCNYLDLLTNQTPAILTRISDINGGSYTVSLSNVVDFIKRKTIESIVVEKFGFMSCRIFRLLIHHVQLEQKQIAEFSMLPLKDCRERLYQMLKFNFLALQEVPRANERTPSRTLYLWKVRSLN
jgi:DNA-directed RNA polymerase III subunit RPC3